MAEEKKGDKMDTAEFLKAIMDKFGISYSHALNTVSGMREVVYLSGAHAPAEYTKEQKEIMEKLKLKL